MFTKLDCPHAMGTDVFSRQRAESFCHFGRQESPPHTVRGAPGSQDRDLRGLPDGPLLDIDGHWGPSTPLRAGSRLRAMTEREGLA
jgi:hypothetical protein